MDLLSHSHVCELRSLPAAGAAHHRKPQKSRLEVVEGPIVSLAAQLRLVLGSGYGFAVGSEDGLGAAVVDIESA